MSSRVAKFVDGAVRHFGLTYIVLNCHFTLMCDFVLTLNHRFLVSKYPQRRCQQMEDGFLQYMVPNTY